MDYNFKSSYFNGTVQLRWLTANCYEIKLPDGTTIVFDPFLPPAEGGYEKWNHYSCGVTVDGLEGADYAIIGHPHGDHIGSLPELYDRFQPRVLAHAAYAINLTRDLLIPQQMIFPYENNQRYEFPSFTLETAVAHHNMGPSGAGRPKELRIPDKGTPFENLNVYGSLFNTNFIVTAENNLKIAFCAGTFEEEERARWEKAGINVVLRQCGGAIRTKDYTSVAKDIMDLHAELLLPLHHESTYGTEDIIDFTEKVNAILAEEGYPGRMFMPERNRWYQIGMTISAR